MDVASPGVEERNRFSAAVRARTFLMLRWTSVAFEDLKLISIRIERERNLASANRVCRAIYYAVRILRRPE
jgi:hypothetical protein